MTVSVRSALPSLKYCFRRLDLYVQYSCGLTPRVTTLVANRPGVSGLSLRYEHDVVGRAHIQVIADDTLKEGASSLWAIEHTGIGDLELAKGRGACPNG
jgi:hypothetical protein